jgi:hypothetical protein
MECPFCGCQNFYVKDPNDEFEIYEFETKDGDIAFSEDVDEADCPAIEEGTETYCNQCAWHGKIQELKKKGD